ncbi:ABC transporter ATP-binding protein [Halobacteria archaeon AArc-m2/3/4]|uniref:Nickel import system ATP-binding protein NikD n=1 Tax=Natronoglomus mannanivorans TaxID=2979990 RepID=A0ABT2Q9U1_9EURY|nr:ABC transporter ATP-binding protein [Halobacteria archaeon AArc-m2/3/4]
MSDEELLRIEGLCTRFFTENGQVNAVENLDLTIDEGEVMGIVGESGSGKSVTALSLIDLVESPGRITDGRIWFRAPDIADELIESGADDEVTDGDFVDLRKLSEEQRRSLRGSRFSTIFQDPMSSFNPSITVGEQIAEAVEVQRRARANPRSLDAKAQRYGLGDYVLSTVLPSKKYVTGASRDRAVELLELVGIPDPVERADEYPHEYSGGMLQRAMIAQALAGEPEVLVADEPTTALDVTIQAQILDLLSKLQAETGMTILLITHNLGVIARMCDRVGVMYAGEIVERGTLEDVFDHPVHPYTRGLLGSVPDLEGAGGRLQPIPGNVPSLLDHEMPDRCYFADRCPKAMDECLEHPPAFDVEGSEYHTTKCYLATTEYTEEKALPDGYFDEAGRAADVGEEPSETETGIGTGTDSETETETEADSVQSDGGEPR